MTTLTLELDGFTLQLRRQHGVTQDTVSFGMFHNTLDDARATNRLRASTVAAVTIKPETVDKLIAIRDQFNHDHP